MAIFTPDEREHIRSELVSAAEQDPRITGAAHLGSVTESQLDRWSDIDLALCLSPDSDYDEVLASWTRRLYEQHGAISHLDIRRGAILYRVFLLNGTLQVDLSFWPATEFRAVGPKFRLIFGTAKEAQAAAQPDSLQLIGMAWLYALHVRSSIARGRLLQAEYMLSGMRENVFALECIGHGVVAVQGRGLDDLPAQVKTQAADCVTRSLEPHELKRTFRALMEMFVDDVRHFAPETARKLMPALADIVNSLEKN